MKKQEHEIVAWLALANGQLVELTLECVQCGDHKRETVQDVPRGSIFRECTCDPATARRPGGFKIG